MTQLTDNRKHNLNQPKLGGNLLICITEKSRDWSGVRLGWSQGHWWARTKSHVLPLGLIKSEEEFLQEENWTVSGDHCQEQSEEVVAGVKNNSCPLVPSGIFTCSSLLQEIGSLQRASQLAPHECM